MLSLHYLLAKIGSVCTFLKIMLRLCFNRFLKVDFHTGNNMKNKGSEEDCLSMAEYGINGTK